MAALAAQVKATYHLAVSPDYAERCAAAHPAMTAAELYKKALTENLKDITDGSTLPYGIASQACATLPNDVVLQISTSRDATLPLRPCADATEEEAALNAALQKSNSRRLLRLVLTDGHVEIPAFELKTLSIFKGVPIPGEKLLIHSGAEVRNGAIIMTEACVTPVGGEVSQLRTEFLAHRKRMEAGYQISGGLEGAPKFQPIHALASGAAAGGDGGLRGHDTRSQAPGGGGGGRARGGRGHGRDRGHGRGSGRDAGQWGDGGRGGHEGGVARTGGRGGSRAEEYRGRGSGDTRRSEHHDRGGRGGYGGGGGTGGYPIHPREGGFGANPVIRVGHDNARYDPYGGLGPNPAFRPPPIADYARPHGAAPVSAQGPSAGFGPSIGYQPVGIQGPSGGYGHAGYGGSDWYSGDNHYRGHPNSGGDGQRGRGRGGGGHGRGRGNGGGDFGQPWPM